MSKQPYDLPAAQRKIIRNHPCRYHVGVDSNRWIHGGNRDHPIIFGNFVTNQWSFLANLLIQSGIPKIEVDAFHNPGVIHNHTLWPDNVVPLPTELNWLAKEINPYSEADYLRGHLDIPKPVPLVYDYGIIGKRKRQLGHKEQAWKVLHAIDVAKEEQHPGHLTQVSEMPLTTRMWWLREFCRSQGGFSVKFSWWRPVDDEE